MACILLLFEDSEVVPFSVGWFEARIPGAQELQNKTTWKFPEKLQWNHGSL
jgi:hypothetical protein